jgi:hypothetical protein
VALIRYGNRPCGAFNRKSRSRPAEKDFDRSFICGLRGTRSGLDGGTPDTLSIAANSAATIVRAIVGLGENGQRRFT